MIVSINKAEADSVRRQAAIFVDNLNAHLEAFRENDLPGIKIAKELRAFATNPNQYFLDQCSVQAKLKNLDGANPTVYAQLFDLSFEPDLQKMPLNPDYLEYVAIQKGMAKLSADFEEKIAGVGLAEVNEPEEVEAAKLLMRTYIDFLFLENLLSSSGNPSMIKTAAMTPLGFIPMQLGQLNPEAVKQLTVLMKDHPRSEFAKRIAEASGNENFLNL